MPELRRVTNVVREQRQCIKQQRAALAKPKIDSTDLAAAMLRQEMRLYLRGLNLAERMNVLLTNPDPAMLAAALEGPAALADLTPETRAHVEKAYLETNHSHTLKAMDDREKVRRMVRDRWG